MSAPFETPQRLAREAAPLGGTPSDADAATRALAGRLLRLTQATPSRLSTASRARIAARLDAEAHPVAATRGRALWPAFALGALVLFAGGAVGAALGIAPARQFVIELLHRPQTKRAAARVAPAAPVEAPRPAAPAPIVVPEEAPTPEPVAAPVRLHAHAAPKAHAVARPVADAPSAEEREAPIVAESRLLADALTTLRQRRDPQQALRALDAYDRRYPDGALALEAAAARIDALLALGRRGQALERLEALPLARVPRGAELRVLRGELRAGRGRLDEAVDDFTAVLAAGDAPAAVIERALYGRGSCRSRLGDTAGARADLREVVRRFPSGAHARDAERALRD